MGNRVFDLEGLEGRTLLSVSVLSSVMTALNDSNVAAIIAPTPIAITGSLAGAVTGTYMETPDTTTSDLDYSFNGRGLVSPLGTVKLTGTLDTPAVNGVASGTGTLVLKNSLGTVTLALSPMGVTLVKMPIPLMTYAYKVASGTGAYRHFKAAGLVGMRLTPYPSTQPSSTVHGTFTFNFIPRGSMGPVQPA